MVPELWDPLTTATPHPPFGHSDTHNQAAQRRKLAQAPPQDRADLYRPSAGAKTRLVVAIWLLDKNKDLAVSS